MIGHTFEGEGVSLDSPYGGSCHVALGVIVEKEGEVGIPAVAIRVNDEEGAIVVEFALRPGTFATLLEAMMQAFNRVEPGTLQP